MAGKGDGLGTSTLSGFYPVGEARGKLLSQKFQLPPPIDFVTAPQLTNTFSRPVYVTIPFFALHRIQIPTP